MGYTGKWRYMCVYMRGREGGGQGGKERERERERQREREIFQGKKEGLFLHLFTESQFDFTEPLLFLFSPKIKIVYLNVYIYMFMLIFLKGLIQHNFNQNPNKLFYEYQQSDFKVYMNRQKTQNNQQNIEE